MSVFSDLEDEVSDMVDEVFGDQYRFLPMMQDTVNSPVAPDTQRAVREPVIGIYSGPTRVLPELGAKTVTQGFASGHAPNMTTQETRIGFDLSEFAAGQLPRRLDRFLDLGNGKLWSVSDVQPDSEGRIVCFVAFVKKVGS